MRLRVMVIAPALALPLLLAGCGGSSAALDANQADPPTASTSAMPGMGHGMSSTAGAPIPSHTMADGTVMAGASMAPGTKAGPTKPSATASMVCGTEIQESIAILLKLPTRPTGTRTFTDGLFTCTYRLAAGTLVLSVQESGSDAAAKGYFDGLRSGVGASASITGLPSLGLPAFQSASGIVSFVKDSFTLKVDASQMAATLGPGRTTRGDLAYTVATDVLACWRGH